MILIVPHEDRVTRANIPEITKVRAEYAPLFTLSSKAELIYVPAPPTQQSQPSEMNGKEQSTY